MAVEGHAFAPVGSMNNWDLSSLRATAVMEFFIEEANFLQQALEGLATQIQGRLRVTRQQIPEL